MTKNRTKLTADVSSFYHRGRSSLIEQYLVGLDQLLGTIWIDWIK